MVGSHLGERYELTLLQQEGPIFAAYSAKDKVLGREVTIRVLKPPFSAEYRFVEVLQEIIKRAGSVRHPNVEKLIELQQDPSVVYLVSESSRGAVLAERIKKLAPYSVPVAVGMVISTLDGLEAIHNSGYVHGDPGAHNIVVQPDGTSRIELTGVWEAYASSETAGAVMLPSMAAYLAPEVTAGGAPSTTSDTYAIGVILFQLLTGQYPYPADTPVAMAMKHATGAIPSARALNPAVPSTLDEVVRRALAKDPSQRYPDASKMLSDLRKIEDTVRFGKAAAPVSKPSPVEASAPVAASSTLGESKSAKVASQSGPAKKAKATYVEEREPRDVPIWMTILFTFFLAVAVSLVGVWYFFSMNAPKAVVVPDIRGKTRENAQQILERKNLSMRVAGQETSETVPTDSVVEVDPAPGAQAREGGTVAVKLSAGSRLVTIPDLRGKSLDDARAILAKLSINLNRTDPIDDTRVPKGMIVRQTPTAKNKVERFTQVNVWVSTGAQAEDASEPPATRDSHPDTRYLYTVRIKLTKILDPVTLRVDITDANGTRKIYEAQHYPNEEVTIRTEGFGSHAVFRIYYNGQFVTQVSKEADSASSNQNDNSDEDNGDAG